jgi:hypothetical protein
MKADQKELKRNYQQTPRAMGVFLIRNNFNDKVFLAAGTNLQGLMNRHRFQLEHRAHPNKELQADWNVHGSQNFAFEIVDEIVPTEGRDPRQEVTALEDLWLDKLRPFDERGYNQRKLTRAERLRRIAHKETE